VFGRASGTVGTVADLLNHYTRHRCRHKRETTLHQDANRAKRIGEWEWGDRPAANVRVPDVIAYVDHRLEGGVSINTIRRELAVLAGAYGAAIDDERLTLPENPIRVAMHKKRKEWKEREADVAYYMTPAECRAVLDVAGDLEFMVFTALTTAMRRKEMLELRWADVDLEAEHLFIRAGAAKNGTSRHVPLSPALLARMKAEKGKALTINKNALVFAGWTPGCVSRRWIAIREEVGVPARFHDTRHTAAAQMARNGVPLSEIQKIGGWKTLQMVARYTRFVPKQAATIALDVLVA